MIQVKTIKPSKLNSDAMRAALMRGMEKTGEDAITEYNKTVKTWDNPPDFEALMEIDATGPTLVVGPTGNADAVQHYEWVDKGTKRHWIAPRRAKALRFRSKYKSKTVPNVIGSRAGRSSGKTVFSKGHWVSGIEARNFDKIISKTMQPRFKKRMEQAMKEAANVSGHKL